MSPSREYSGFAVSLRELRLAAGFTQAQLAEKAGLYANSIARLERGEREPTLAVGFKLADALGVKLDALRGNPKKKPVKRSGRPLNQE